MSRIYFIALCISLFSISACNQGPTPLPNITGKAGEVCVVVDKATWDGPLGTSLREMLTAPYPALPQVEPSFTLFNIAHSAFSKIFQAHRNLVIISVSSEISEEKFTVAENIWARPQVVVNITAPTVELALALLLQKKEILVSSLEQAERNRVISNAKRFEEPTLRMLVNESFGGSPYFPNGYSLLKQSSNKDFIWIAYETTYTNQGILVYSYPYVDSTSLSKSHMVKMRNEFLQREVPGPVENSYMITSPNYDADIRWVHYNYKDFAEMRGLWEVQNDFMGGPFVSHSFINPKTHDVLVIEAFVYAPRFDKRNYLRQVESILYSFEWEDKQPVPEDKK
jgi:hypothetical protein